MKRSPLLLVLSILVATAVYAGEPKVTVEDYWQKAGRHGETSRLERREPTMRIGQVWAIRLPAVTGFWRWFIGGQRPA